MLSANDARLIQYISRSIFPANYNADETAPAHFWQQL
jgi:hypothetical protein